MTKITAKTLDRYVNRMRVSMSAFTSLTSEDSKKYFSELHPEDISHNMQSLFTELNTIQQMIQEEIDAIHGLKIDLEKIESSEKKN